MNNAVASAEAFGDVPPGKDVIDVVQQQRFSDEKQQVSLLPVGKAMSDTKDRALV